MPGKKRTAEEVSSLRRRAAELEDELRQLRGAIGGREGSAVTTPSTSVEDVLKLRATRATQPFKISTWDHERKESHASSSGGAETTPKSELAVVAVDASQSAPDSRIPKDDALVLAEDEAKLVVSRAPKTTWIAQPGLGMSRHHNVEPDVLLSGVEKDLATARPDVVIAKLDDVFAQHLINHHRHPHLAFSSAMVSLYNIFREGRLAGSPANKDEVNDECFLRCANLARHFMAKSRFPENPPLRRPADIDRALYVRELCTQAGLSLDLVRLGYAHEKHIEKRKPIQTDESEVPSTGSSASSEGCKQAAASVGQEEVQSHLARAGRYLAAVQMDMDRHRDEFGDQGMSAVSGQSTPYAERSKDTEQMPALQDVVPSSAVDGLPHKPDRVLPLKDLHTPELAQDGSPSQDKVVGDKLLALVRSSESMTSDMGILDRAGTDQISSNIAKQNEEGVRNALLVPSFGEFLEQQLLPLYVADVPFQKLKTLTETCCGILLDSDDEREAWDAVGLAMPVVTKSTRKKRRRIASPMHNSEPANLVGLSDLLGKSKAKVNAPVMRAQMQTSIVEKRRNNFRTFRNMDNAKTTASHVPNSTPAVKTARALLHGSTPLSSQLALANQAVVYPEMSPLSVRKHSRGRLEMQASSRSTRSEKNLRTPRTTSQPDWDAM